MLCPGCQSVNAAGAANCSSCGRILRLEVGTVLAGRYEIEAILGQGGMGTVYRAHDRSLDEAVAIKVLRPEMIADDAMARRFLAEIKTARKIAHRNVCRIHEYGEDHGLRFISMAYVEGVDLKQILRQQGALPWEEGFEVAIRVAEALEAIHYEGIVHRDLKTPNIMRDLKGVVRVMDFGIAKDEAVVGMTQTGMIVGTPEYMSPEQAMGSALDFRADLYALGIVIFELFTGGVPFRSETPMGTLMKQIQQAPPLDGPEAERIPPAVLPILHRLLAKDPAERHASTQELVEDLKAARDATLGASATPRGLRAAGGVLAAGSSTSTSVPAATIANRTVTRAMPERSTRTGPTMPAPLPLVSRADSAPPPPARGGTSMATLVLGGLAVLLIAGIGLAGAGWFLMQRSAAPIATPSVSTTLAAAPVTTTMPAVPPTQPPPPVTEAPPATTLAEKRPAASTARPTLAPAPTTTLPAPVPTAPPVTAAAAPSTPPPHQGPNGQWTVAHDHGAAFQQFCVGTLTLDGGHLSFNSPQHAFNVPMSDIKEIQRNGMYAIAYGAFHVKLKNGPNYNLAALNQAGKPTNPMSILTVLHMAKQ